MVSIAELASAVISVFEGPERLAAFQDTGGVWTIGCGHTDGIRAGMTCTHEQALAWFTQDQAHLLRMVSDKSVFVGAGYVSFGYNCGAGALDAVLCGLDSIDNPKHTTDHHGVVQPGLVSRRRLEALLIAA